MKLTITQFGYCYVLELSNGSIKVGMTKSSSERLRTHKANARSVGVQISRHEFVACQGDRGLTEKRLIQRCARAGRQIGPETFDGLKFSEVAQWLREECLNPEQKSATPALSTAQPGAWHGWILNSRSFDRVESIVELSLAIYVSAEKDRLPEMTWDLLTKQARFAINDTISCMRDLSEANLPQQEILSALRDQALQIVFSQDNFGGREVFGLPPASEDEILAGMKWLRENANKYALDWRMAQTPALAEHTQEA